MDGQSIALVDCTSKSLLDKLPQEVLRNIALKLDVASVLRLTETNKTLCKALSNDPVIWSTFSKRSPMITDHVPTSRTAFLMLSKVKRKPELDPLMNQAVENSDDISFSLPAFSRSTHQQRMTMCMLPDVKNTSPSRSGLSKSSDSGSYKSMFDDDSENMDAWFSRKLQNPLSASMRQARDFSKNSGLGNSSMTMEDKTSHIRAQSMVSYDSSNRRRLNSDAGNARRGAFVAPSKNDELQTYLKKREHVPESYRFDTLLANPEYRGLKMGIERFMKRFESATQGSVDKEGALVNGLLREIEREMHKLPVWKTLPPNHFALAKEDMERSIFTRLYPVIYIKREFQQRDSEVLEHIAKIRNVLKPIYLNLDDSLVENQSIHTAMKELHKVDSFKSPMDKVNCVYNASRIVSYVLSSGSGGAVASDDFLPLFIYVVMKTELHGPCSTIEFVERYIDPEEKFGEAYCFFTHFIGAITYLKNQKPELVAREVEKKTLAKKQAEIDKMPSLFEESFEQLNESAATMSKSLEEHPLIIPRIDNVIRETNQQQRSASTPVDGSSTPTFVTAAADPLSQPPKNTSPALAKTRTRAAARATTEQPTIDVTPQDGESPKPKEENTLPPAIFDQPDKESDSEFLSQLHFIEAIETPRSDEDIALLISEYKKLAEIAKRYLPVVTKNRTWRKESAVRNIVMEIPGDSRITCLLVSNGYAWAGLQNGNVCVCRPQRGDICGTISVHHNSIAKLLQVGNVIWCVSSIGAVSFLDPTFLNVSGKGFNVHDKKHSSVIDVIYDSATGYAWSVGIPDPLRSTRKVKMETQLTRVQVSSGVQKSFIVPGCAVSASLFRGVLWIAFEDGKIVPYNTTTGVSTGAIGPFTQPNSHTHIVMTSPNQQQMWFSTGDTLQVIKGSIGIDMMPVMTRGLSGRIVALSPSSIAWNRVTSSMRDSSSTSSSTLTDEHEDCKVVVSVDAVGTICVWNTLDRTCEVSIPTTLQEPLCLACSSATEQGQAWWVAAQQNTLYCWLYA